jgi:elongation factor 1 alpha-like protein
MHVLGSVSDRERHRNARDARAAGKASFAWAWALDARPEERARGVTVDVAKVFLDTGKTLVHLMDAPGHRDFVPNAIAGAAQADAACLVVDASRGAFESGFRDGTVGDSETGGGGVGVSACVGGQTREHVRLARSLGVEHLIVAVSKMDACAYSQARFEEIKGALAPFLKKSGFADDAVAWTPVSGADGTNLVPRDFSLSRGTGLADDDAKKRDDGDDDDDDARERRLERERALESFRSWYPEDDPKNLCLVAAMDAIPEPERGRPMPLRFPASELVGAGDRFLGPCAVGGKVEAGSVRAGDTVAVAPAGILATVKAVRVISSASENGGGGDSRDQVAFAGDAADIGLDLPDASCLVPGTVLCHASFPLVPATRFTVKLVTLDALRVPLLVGTTVVVHAYASSTEARVTKLVSSLDKKNGDVLRRAPRCVSRDAAAVVELTPSRALAVERFEDYQKLGRVQLRRDGATVALGVVVETFFQ